MFNNLFRLASALFGKQAPDPRLPPVSPSPTDRPSNEPEDSTPEDPNVTPPIIHEEKPMPYLRKSNRKITRLIFHYLGDVPSDTFTADAKTVKRWHTDPKPHGNGWNDIGYHGIVMPDGSFQLGRDVNIMGAHTYSKNKGSIGILLSRGVVKGQRGPAKFTKAMMETARKVMEEQEAYYDGLEVGGHRDYRPSKCPSFNVGHWRETGEVIA